MFGNLGGIFRQEEEANSIRQVYVFNRYPDGVKPQAFADNAIKTSKYTIWNFIPKNLYEQFKRIANFYFLCVVIIMLCIETPIGPGTTMMPLIIVVTISLFKQGFEDYNRHKADNEVNHRLVNVIRHGCLQQINSKNIRVGDVVKLECEDEFPCDMVLVSSSDEEGSCFITTANLDGETNLKILTCPDETKSLLTVQELYGLDASIECEPPNVDLYRFQGRIIFATDTNLDNISAMKSLGSSNLLLRGATLKNTKFVYGVPVYTGKDTKMALNQAQAQYKLPSIEWKMNMYILFFCFMVVALATVLTIVEFFWEVECDKRALYRTRVTFSHSIGGFLNDFFSFIVLFNYVIPISLYVTVEAVKFISSYFVKWDLEMYHAETDTPAKANTSDLNEELGQIEYVFSDKTGTLTENELVFRKCSIEGVKYAAGDGVLIEEASQIAVDLANQNVKDFLITMSLCHSVFTTEQQGNLKYEASSPDEKALVEAAAEYGIKFMFASRNSRKIRVEGNLDRYEFLYILPFDNTRKRMSIILRDPSGKILLLCKGAESSVLDICDSGCVDVTRKHVDDYAAEGLRTLVFAMKEISPEDYTEVDRLMVDCQNAINDREAKEQLAFQSIEDRLCCIGVTGVEDRLQDGVYDTISALKEGGVKLWVLTGDKMETAVNISQSCNHFTVSMKLHFLTARRDGESCKQTLDSLLKLLEGTSRERNQTYGLIVDGTSLATCFNTCPELFLRTTLLCTAVLCCRLSPLQKAKVVRMVKEHKTNPVTLAIGDGANDVSMILEANVGVGIYGKEGRQAVRSCDFAIARFQYLRNLMFVHGHYYYRRISTVVFYFFYKNVTFVGPAICFLFMNGYSPQTIYSELQLIGFNLMFSALPIISYGLFEQHLPPTLLYEKPSLYKESAKTNLLAIKYFVAWMALAVWNCFVIFIFDFSMFYDAGGFNSSQRVGGLWCYGTVAYTSVIFVINIMIALKTRFWVWFTHFTIWGTLLSYVIISYFYAMWTNPNVLWLHETNDATYVFIFLFSCPVIYLEVAMVVVLCVLPPVLVMLLQHHMYPMEADKFRLQDWNKVHAGRDYRPCCGYRLNSFTLTQYFGLGGRDGMGYSGEQLVKRDDSEKYQTGSAAYGSIRRGSAGES
ncbi:phospholipid-transporting ATPase IF-like isoform X1 [Bolinopsis microptera]|uniref:phospholipid-transporting ATPase IF-like isoform X1 n=1 Tax=Bolinopsis microptera TaxID=2820187 RepID=UPI00307AC3EA